MVFLMLSDSFLLESQICALMSTLSFKFKFFSTLLSYYGNYIVCIKMNITIDGIGKVIYMYQKVGGLKLILEVHSKVIHLRALLLHY